jgi:predicted O-methyltransferase YrrM
MEQLLALPKYRELCKLKSGVGDNTTGISDKEVKHLSWLGANVPLGGNIIDLGSHKGKSVCAIALGAQHAGNDKATIFAIDLWTTGTTNFAHQSSQDAYDTFLKQIAQMGLSDKIRVLMTSSLQAASKRGKPVHLIFIDASHKYVNVLADYNAWSKFVPSGGRIAFHDYQTRFDGVQKVVDEVVIPSGLWSDYHIYDHIWSATKI